MSRTAGLVAGLALVAALAARALLPGAEEEPVEDFWAPARQVDTVGPATTWEPAGEVRDPFIPLVLPPAPAPSPEDLEEE